MKRELKFRCFDTLSPKMYVGHSLAISANGTISFLDDTGNWIEPEQGRVIVMQFTGFKDRNGKDIYEGDLLIVFAQKMVVEWNTSSACFQLRETKNPVYNDLYSIMNCRGNEIIGNVYENPELLNRK